MTNKKFPRRDFLKAGVVGFPPPEVQGVVRDPGILGDRNSY